MKLLNLVKHFALYTFVGFLVVGCNSTSDRTKNNDEQTGVQQNNDQEDGDYNDETQEHDDDSDL